MPDYSKGQIYKITDIGMNKCYVGSTVQQLCRRMCHHRKEYKRYLNGIGNYYSVFSLFGEFGVENCRIIWVKDFPCNSKKELEAEEEKVQKEHECINRYIAGRTPEQYKQNTKEERSKKQKERRENNLEFARQKDREHYHKTKANRYRPYHCQCGAVVGFGNRLIHFKSTYHKQYLQNQNNPQEYFFI